MLVVASTLTLLVSVFPAIIADLGPGPLFFYRLLVFPADVALGLTLAAAVGHAIASKTRPGPGVMLLGALTVALAVAFVFHPSAQGVFAVARFAGATGLAYAISILTRTERPLAAGALAVAATAQLGIGLAQIARAAPLGLSAIGEIADPLNDYYGTIGPRGTMHAQYALGGLALIAAIVLVREAFDRRRALAWSVAAGIAVIPVGITFSRAVALGLVLAIAALGLGLRSRPRITVAAILCLALGAGGAAFVDRAGWAVKSEDGISTNGRDIGTAGAIALIESSPLVGVGPGRAVYALKELYPEPPPIVGYRPPHAFPLLAAAEGGVIAGAIATALPVVVGWRARRDPRALALFGAFIPVLLTDHYPYTFLQGLVLLAVWIGTLDSLSRPPARE